MSGSDDQTLEHLDDAALAYAERRRVATPEQAVRDRRDFTVACLPFAGRLARRYRGRGESLEDLVQVARLGLVKAVDRYEPARGSFTAYALVTIHGEIKRHFRDKTWDLHVPRRMQDLSLEVGRATQTMTMALARTPTAAELARHLSVSEAAVRDAQGSSAGYATASLNAPLGDGFSELGDMLGGADADLEKVDDLVTVEGLIRRLPERDRRLLTLRFHGNRTQAQIAAELGISQMHVSRLLSRALAGLREAMLSDAAPLRGPRVGDLRLRLIERDEGVVVVVVDGEVDRDNSERLRTGLRHAVRRASEAVVADLSGVPLMDAAGISALLDVAAAASAAGVGLRLTGVQPYAAKVMAFGGLSPLMD